jgi:hypothetical protein
LVTDHQIGYRKDDIQRAQASLADVPELANLQVGKQEAARLLAPTIHGLQGKGYRRDLIAALVSHRGVTITATTLKKDLQRVKPRGKAAAKMFRNVCTGEINR